MASPAHPEDPLDAEDELDLQRVRELAGFCLRAPRRHPWLAAVAGVAVLGLGAAVALLWPKSYGCDTRILAQRNLVLPALDNPTRAVPHEADNPTRSAADSILRRDNLVALVKELDLLDRWESTRPLLLRAKDRLFGLLMAPRSDDDRLRDMIDLLEKRLAVGVDESSVTISVTWRDREMALQIISFLQKNFLEARYDSSLQVISEAIRILQEREKPLAAEVERAFAELSRLEAERDEKLLAAGLPLPRARRGGSPARRAAKGKAPGDDPATPDRAQQEDVLAQQVDADRQREIAQLTSQLAEANATLGAKHPKVVALQQRLEELEAKSAELQALEENQRTLIAELEPPPQPSAPSETSPAKGQAADDGAEANDTARHLAARAVLDPRDDPPTARARVQLVEAQSNQNELRSRIAAANIELDVTRAAFKYQYSVVRPPQLPRRPLKPNVLLLLLVSALASLLATIAVPAASDLLGGRLIEPWQVTRGLKIALLGELPSP